MAMPPAGCQPGISRPQWTIIIIIITDIIIAIAIIKICISITILSLLPLSLLSNHYYYC